jgi:hypothetical protein
VVEASDRSDTAHRVLPRSQTSIDIKQTKREKGFVDVYVQQNIRVSGLGIMKRERDLEVRGVFGKDTEMTIIIE